MTKSKLKEDNESIKSNQEAEAEADDFMPKWAKEEKCFKEARVYDFVTKKFSEDGWVRQKPTMQAKYENWKAKVTNPKTKQYYPKKDQKTGLIVPDSGARYIVSVITRVRDAKGKNKYLTTKGWLEGFNETGRVERRWIAWPEVHIHTEFAYERYYNEKTGAAIEYTIGPAVNGTQEIYSLDFTEANARQLFSQTENEDIEFNVKDLKTGEAKKVAWSSVKETLNLFIHKPFSYLFKSEFIPLPVGQEARQEAVAKGLIHGVASDYELQSSAQASVVGVE